MDGELTIATADAAGVATLIDWAAAEGWNPGVRDAAAFRAADPDGFLLGSIQGEPIGGISIVRYGPSFAFLGLYLVRPEWRGRGHGIALWRAAIERAGERTIGLDGVPQRQEDYRRSGFVHARRNIRYRGRGAPGAAGGGLGSGIVPVASVDRAALHRYDVSIFPAPRERFLDAWVDQPGVQALAAVRDGALRGYAVARPCRVGVKIGPLFADDDATADALFAALAAWTGDRELVLDVPEPNAAAHRLAERHDLAPTSDNARMYAGPAPQEPLERIFGLTTYELG